MHEHTSSSDTPISTDSRGNAVYHATHDTDSAATLSTTVIHALADCMGVDVTDGNLSLYDSIDPDALDTLFRPRYDGTPRSAGMLTFFVHDYRVTVHSDGNILIEPPSRE